LIIFRKFVKKIQVLLTLILLMWRLGELIIMPENSGLADWMFL